jgi:hypothetical protein
VKRFVVSVAVVAVAALGVPVIAIGSAAAAGNSANAKACQKGGWQNLVRDDGTAFANQGECVSYGAQGGTLTPPVLDSDGDGVPDASDVCPDDGDAGDGVYADGCPKDILVIAYSNLDGEPGYNATADVLIAKLVDETGDGVSPGDTVKTNQYPLTLTPSSPYDPTDYGTFRTTTHTVSTVLGVGTGVIGVVVDGFPGVTVGFTVLAYTEQETVDAGTLYYTNLSDCTGACTDLIDVTEGLGPSNPDTTAGVGTPRSTDDPFIDIDFA